MSTHSCSLKVCGVTPSEVTASWRTPRASSSFDVKWK